MKQVKVIGMDFEATINVDADRNDVVGAISFEAGASDLVQGLLTDIISMGTDDKGIMMSSDYGSINGIAKTMDIVGYDVEYDDSEAVEPDEDGIQ